MSDAAIATIVSGSITIATMIVGLLTLWVKLKYKAEVVESKVDDNTKITKEGTAHAAASAQEAKDTAKEVAENINQKLNGGLDSLVESTVKPLSTAIHDHDARIMALEDKVAVIRAAVDGVSKNIDSTRHEMRSHLQTVTNKLDLLGATLPKKESAP